MGYTKHHAIILTSWKKKLIHEAHQVASEIWSGESSRQISGIVESVVNTNYSFFIGPDGSNEGWADSYDGDTKRKCFIEWIESNNYEDGSNPISYCEISYNDDSGIPSIVNYK